MVIVDTSIIIDHLRQKNGLPTVLYKLVKDLDETETMAISVITIQELYTGASTRREIEEGRMLGAISNFDILPFDYREAKLAGELGRDAASSPGFADLAIAATAILNNAKLATFNLKDFTSIKEIELFDLENL